jgi:hypothetical protein
MAYADDVNIVEEDTDTIQRNTKALLDASKEVCLEVNPEETKYMLVSRCQKAGQRQSIIIGNRSFESVAKFKYLGTTLTDQNFTWRRSLQFRYLNTCAVSRDYMKWWGSVITVMNVHCILQRFLTCGPRIPGTP